MAKILRLPAWFATLPAKGPARTHDPPQEEVFSNHFSFVASFQNCQHLNDICKIRKKTASICLSICLAVFLLPRLRSAGKVIQLSTQLLDGMAPWGSLTSKVLPKKRGKRSAKLQTLSSQTIEPTQGVEQRKGCSCKPGKMKNYFSTSRFNTMGDTQQFSMMYCT